MEGGGGGEKGGGRRRGRGEEDGGGREVKNANASGSFLEPSHPDTKHTHAPAHQQGPDMSHRVNMAQKRMCTEKLLFRVDLRSHPQSPFCVPFLTAAKTEVTPSLLAGLEPSKAAPLLIHSDCRESQRGREATRRIALLWVWERCLRSALQDRKSTRLNSSHL